MAALPTRLAKIRSRLAPSAIWGEGDTALKKERTQADQQAETLPEGNGNPLAHTQDVSGGGSAGPALDAVYMGRGGGAPWAGLRTFQSLKNYQYRLYFGASMAQFAAMNMQMMARAWFMYALTGSVIMLGLSALSNAIPMLGLSLFGGVIADRVQKKYVMLGGQIANLVIALGIGIAITLGTIHWAHLIVAGLLQGTVMGLMMPARQAIIAEIVGREDLMNAVALNSAGMNVNRLLAPAAAGILIAVLGIQGVYYSMAGLYLVATLFIASMALTGTTSLRGGGALSDIRDGLSYIRHQPTILAILVFALAVVLFSMPYMFLLPVFAKDILIIEAEQMRWLTSIPLIGGLLESLPDLLAKDSFRLGLLISVSGVGAIAGSLIIASLGNQNRGKLLLFSSLLLGVGLAAFAFSPWYLVSLLVMIPIGLGQAGRMTLGNTLLQSYVEDAYRGRVMAVYMMEFGLTSFTTFAVAVIAGFIGVQWAVGGMALILIAVVVYYYLFVPRIRHLD